jgi:S1-C subfamily serine protease
MVIDVTPLPARPRRERRTAAALAATALFALVGWRMGSARFAEVDSAAVAPVSTDPTPQAASGELSADEVATIGLFERAAPSVVHITNVAVVRRGWRSRDLAEIPQSTGSGFVWDDRGHVVTNFHVVANSDAVKVRLADGGEPVDAEVVGAAPHLDLAVARLKDVPRERLRALSVGASGGLRVGQRVYAIGNPFGLDQTLTTGIISGLSREIRSVTGHKIKGVIQTDAAINPGNSGGPLLDSSGRLVGVNTAIVSPSGAYAGIGFAVPVDLVRRAVPELIARGRVSRPGIGVVLLDEERAARLRLAGVGIETVREDSAAAKAGLRSMVIARNGAVSIDEIVAVDDVPIRSHQDLFDVIDEHDVGDTVTLAVRRGGDVVTVRVRLQAVD